MKQDINAGPSTGRWCTWKLVFILISLQLLVLLIYQGYFSGVLVVAPSQRWPTLNISLHRFGVNEWIFPSWNTTKARITGGVYANRSANKTSMLLNSSDIDIHEEDPEFGHVFTDTHGGGRLPQILTNSIAMGLGITSRRLKWGSKQELLKSFPFFKSFLPTFCKTVSKGYGYNFFLAYDHDDPFYNDIKQLKVFQDQVFEYLSVHCTQASNYSLHFVQCSHRKEPARAQNDAMMAAYMSNMEYYYRINDDTRMTSSGWTEQLISALKSYNPPLVGVVGPNHRGGNTAILTYDFVHYTHIHIHGYYYPRPLTDWYADTWITNTYRPDRSQKLKSVKLDHTMETGQRYSVKRRSKDSLNKIIQTGKDAMNNYISLMKQNQNISASGERVISMSLAGRNPQHTYGAIRNAQLLPLYFPSWKLRIYLLGYNQNVDPDLLVPRPVIDKLTLLGVQIFFLGPEFARTDPALWKYQVADDKAVKLFLVRDPRGRFSAREAFVSGEWLKQKQPFFCIRDRSEHKKQTLVPGLFGATTGPFSDLLKPTVSHSLLKNKTISTEDYLMSQVVWPKVQGEIGCFDTVSGADWPGRMNVTVLKEVENLPKIGTWYSEFEEELH